MPGTLTLVGEGLVLDWLFTTGTPTRPTTWFVALHTGANGGAGASNEIVGNGYARQAVTFTRVGNVMSNTALMTFGPDSTVPWGTVTDITIWSLVSGGVCLAQGTVSASVPYTVGDSATLAVGAVQVTLT